MALSSSPGGRVPVFMNPCLTLPAFLRLFTSQVNKLGASFSNYLPKKWAREDVGEGGRAGKGGEPKLLLEQFKDWLGMEDDSILGEGTVSLDSCVV